MTLPDCMMPDGAAPCEGFKSLNAELESVEKIRDVLAKTVNAQEAELERLRRIERAAQALSDEAQEYAMDFGLGCAAPNSYWEDLWEALDPDPLKDERPCTCHPDDNPPQPCPKKYALTECRQAARAAAPAEPGAWMHDGYKVHPGMEQASVDAARLWVISNIVKRLWLDCNPKQVEHYTIPLYACPIRDSAWVAEAMRLADEYAKCVKWNYEHGSIVGAARAALAAHLKAE